jgi:hypothetical protein
MNFTEEQLRLTRFEQQLRLTQFEEQLRQITLRKNQKKELYEKFRTEYNERFPEELCPFTTQRDFIHQLNLHANPNPKGRISCVPIHPNILCNHSGEDENYLLIITFVENYSHHHQSPEDATCYDEPPLVEEEEIIYDGEKDDIAELHDLLFQNHLFGEENK